MSSIGGRILVVDDDAGCRALICEIFEAAGLATAEAESGEAGLTLARAVKPLLVILDVRLPGVSGYEVCHQLKNDFRDDVPVVLVSGERTEGFDHVAGLLIGADEYVSKPFVPDELLARVRRLIRPAAPVSPQAESDLTRRELQVLRLLAAGLRQREIAERLSISPKTVASHIEQVLPKLGVHSRAEAVAAAYSRGIVETESPNVGVASMS